MSTRRKQRAGARPIQTAEEAFSRVPPAVLMLGRCVEVWAAPHAEVPSWSATRRFAAARTSWLAHSGLAEGDDVARELKRGGAPWSVEHLSYRGQAERLGRTAHDLAAARFARVGLDLMDLPRLAAQADALTRRST